MGKARVAASVRGLCAVLFMLGALVQYNDPDPLRWIAMYMSAAVACLAAGRFRWSFLPALGMALVALGWAIWIASKMPAWVPPSAMFAPMPSMGGAVEMARETWGLGIMSLLLVWVSWSVRSSSTPSWSARSTSGSTGSRP